LTKILKKIKSYESLVLSLFIGDNFVEKLEDLSELEECFAHLRLDESVESALSSKRVKEDEELIKKREEAHNVLFDFLTSLLTRQNSSLRHSVNFVFKAFCAEMNTASLTNFI